MLNEKLDSYLKEGYYPFHMPGHKRNKVLLNSKLPYDRDLTEITDFDNLNDPKSLFLYMEEALAKIYKAKEAIISTNGSTCSILASMRSLGKKNKKILISRFSHKSVYNAIEVFDFDVDYIKSIYNKDGFIVDIDYDDLEKKLSTNDYDLVILTSPTYQGFILNLKKAHYLCKKTKTPLLVDMAHGSHLNLYDDYEKYTSYDLAVCSLHKNLSALTPASCILVRNKSIDLREIRRNMAIFQTSSPSYIVCQSIDDMITSYPKFPILKENLDINLEEIYQTKLNKLEFINNKRKDRTKILISTKNTNISGYDLQKLLLEKKIEIEMAQKTYVLLISSIFDTKEAFDLLKNSLIDIDRKIKKSNICFKLNHPIAQKKMKISKAMAKKKTLVDISMARGKVSGQHIYSYPPGIPLVVAGEVFSDEILKQIKDLIDVGANLSLDNGKVLIVN